MRYVAGYVGGNRVRIPVVRGHPMYNRVSDYLHDRLWEQLRLSTGLPTILAAKCAMWELEGEL